jgi:hypothetical protein
MSTEVGSPLAHAPDVQCSTSAADLGRDWCNGIPLRQIIGACFADYVHSAFEDLGKILRLLLRSFIVSNNGAS